MEMDFCRVLALFCFSVNCFLMLMIRENVFIGSCMFTTVMSQWLCHGSAGLWIGAQLLGKTWGLSEYGISVNWYLHQGLKRERHALLIWITYTRVKQYSTCSTLVLYLAASCYLKSDYVQTSPHLSHIAVFSTLIRLAYVCIWSYVANISHG